MKWFKKYTTCHSVKTNRYAQPQGTCRIIASSTDDLCSDNPRKYYELSCGHSFALGGLEMPNYCPKCGMMVMD